MFINRKLKVHIRMSSSNAKISHLHAREILDSRGNPTVEVDLVLDGNIIARSSVPSGASVGSNEAIELRDGQENRYNGKGVLKAVEHTNSIIKNYIVGKHFDSQESLDKMLTELDGTENKSHLGANSILAVSIAFAKAIASLQNKQLFESLGKGNSLPTPLINIINGGAHANSGLDIQEFMVVPFGFESFAEKIRAGAEVFASLKKILSQRKYLTAVGDEGGFAPKLAKASEALEMLSFAVKQAGYKLGDQIALTLDVAASEFYDDGKYQLKGEGFETDSQGLISYLEHLVDNFPIISIEDPMSEHDKEGWKKFTEKLGNRIQIVGDDVFVTNPKLLEDGIKNGIANAILIKPNQIGSVTETLKTIEIAQKAGYKTIISHRSGETEDTFISHLAVATNAGQIKAGSTCRGERIAKYNELLRIEEKVSKVYK